MNETAVATLQELGLSKYEARAYLGLLTGGKQNGNELSRAAAVPSSKIYGTLDKLVASGLVHLIRQPTGAAYIAVPPAELLPRLRDRLTRPLDTLEALLPTLASPEPEPEILQMSNLEAILERAKAMIGTAESTVFLSAWDESLEQLSDALRAADARGAAIFATIYGETSLDVGFCQRHSYPEIVSARIGGHMLTVVVDGAEALFVHVKGPNDVDGVLTRQPLLCLVAEEYMRHDLLLQQAKTMTGLEEWDRWLQTDPAMRALTLGRDPQVDDRP